MELKTDPGDTQKEEIPNPTTKVSTTRPRSLRNRRPGEAVSHANEPASGDVPELV